MNFLFACSSTPSMASSYIDIAIKNDRFCIVQKESKPSDALTVLRKIEKVLLWDLQYIANNDEYSELSQNELYGKLKTIAYSIKVCYHSKFSTSWLPELFTQMQQITASYSRCEFLISRPRQVLPLPHDIIQLICHKLNTGDLANFARLNVQGNRHTGINLISRAQKYGYTGTEVNEVRKLSYWIQGGLVYRSGKLDVDLALKNFKSRSNEYTFNNLSIDDGNLTIARALLSFRTDPNIQNKYGETPLHRAAKYKQVKTVAELLKHNANPNTRSNYGHTPLYDANNAEITELLLKHGAHVDDQINGNCTALHIAACTGEIETLKVLLSFGANPNIQNMEGRTPLHFATKGGHLEVLKILLSFGANPDIPNSHGDTPLAVAVRKEIDSFKNELLRNKQLWQ